MFLEYKEPTEESVKEQTKVITYRKLFIFFILLIIPLWTFPVKPIKDQKKEQRDRT